MWESVSILDPGPLVVVAKTVDVSQCGAGDKGLQLLLTR
jgi:hypothetical protein